MSKATYAVVTLALLILAGAASAAPVTVRLDTHNQRSNSGALSTLKWSGCTTIATTTPCLSTSASPGGTWSNANATPSTAVWTWDAATGVLSMTGIFQTTSFIGSNANGSPVISDKVVDLVINTAASTTTAASYRCVEGTFLASVGASGCLNVSLGGDFANNSSALYDGGGNALCVQRTIGGDDASTGNVRGVTSVTLGNPCDATDGAFDLWTVQLDNTGAQASDRKLVIRNAIPITLPSNPLAVPAEAGANFLTFTAVPNAADDAATAFQDTPTNIDVLANDSAFDDPVTVTTATNPANGTAVVNGSPGTQAGINVTYTPNAGFAATDTFTYTVSSGSATDTATVTVTVVAFGANDDTATTRFNVPATINVLANDVGFTAPVTVTKTDGTNGTVVVNGSPGNLNVVNVTYTPVANFVGTDTFTYTVVDGGSAPTDTATVTVTVTNEVPTAAPGTITSISTVGFDPSTRTGTFNAATNNNLGDAPSVVTASGATNGAVSVSGTTVTFTPSATYFQGPGGGFTYTITDVDGETASSTVAVTIANASPAVGDDTNTTGNANTTLNGSAAFTAGNGSVAQHTLSVQTPAANGSCAASVSGGNIAVAYTPNADYAGGDSCVVRLVDGDGDADDGTFSFTVRAAPGGGGGGTGGLLPGGSGAFDPWSLAFLAGLPLLGRLRASRRRLTAGNR